MTALFFFDTFLVRKLWIDELITIFFVLTR